ncbi:hypothetical protein CANTEDRAFT_116716, partial [Yamadazyma tenuis ATCC 10573]
IIVDGYEGTKILGLTCHISRDSAILRALAFTSLSPLLSPKNYELHLPTTRDEVMRHMFRIYSQLVRQPRNVLSLLLEVQTTLIARG